MSDVPSRADASRSLRGDSAMRSFLLFPALVAAPLLGGCSSINGNPDPVISVSDNINLARNYRIDTALQAFAAAQNSQRGGLSRLQYRNMVVAVYLNAIDSQYSWFRTKIGRQRKVGSILFDLASLGLTGATSFAAKETANRLGAAATGLTGARGSIDKQLYFEQTLPALLAGMDAERARVRTDIVKNLKRNENEYPLAVAFGDISAYETSATLDRAIESLTAKASADRKDAMTELANAIDSCDTDEDLFAPRQRLTNGILAIAKGSDGAAQLAKIANRTNSVAASADGKVLPTADMVRNIRERLLKDYCSVGALNELISAINADLGSQII